MRKLSNKRETEIRARRKKFVEIHKVKNFKDPEMYTLAAITLEEDVPALLAEITRLRNSQFDIVFEPADD